MLRHIVIAALVVIAAFVASPGWAADVEGKVQRVDTSERTVTLDNGTKIWLSDGIAIDGVKEGDQVKVSYEEKDGRAVATSVEMK